MQGPRNDCWLVDSAADVHVYNNKRLMTEYRELPTRIRESTLNNVFSEQKKVKLCLSLKDRSEGLVLNLVDTFYLLNSPYNLVSLARFNNSGIFHNNKDENFYYVKIHQILVQTPQ